MLESIGMITRDWITVGAVILGPILAVQALNMIDIEFYGRRILGTRFQRTKEKRVTNAWKNYNDHLNQRNSYETVETWLRDGDTHFTKLLYEMSIALGYDYDEVQLKRDSYRPEAHVSIENAQLDVLSGLASVLKHERSIPMAVTYFPNMQPPAESTSAQAGKGDGTEKPTNEETHP